MIATMEAQASHEAEDWFLVGNDIGTANTIYYTARYGSGGVAVFNSFNGFFMATFCEKGVFIRVTDAYRPLPNSTCKPSQSDWEMFKLEAGRLFGIELPEEYLPKWLDRG